MQLRFEEAETPPTVANQSNVVAVAEPTLQPEGQAVEKILESLKNARPKWKRRYLLVAHAGLSGIVLALIGTHGLGMVACAFLYIIVGLILDIAVDTAVMGRDKRLTRQLARYDDRRAVGLLLEALRYHDETVTMAATAALIRLLPQLHSSDRHLLTLEHRTFMNGLMEANVLLGPPAKSPLILAILKALEQVGDVGALRVVKKLANGEGTGKDPAVRQAAVECLPFLKVAARQAEEQITLLRASGADSSPEELLLPAAPGLDNHAEQLLRPL